MRQYGIEVIGEISLCQFSSLTQVSKILSYSVPTVFRSLSLSRRLAKENAHGLCHPKTYWPPRCLESSHDEAFRVHPISPVVA